MAGMVGESRPSGKGRGVAGGVLETAKAIYAFCTLLIMVEDIEQARVGGVLGKWPRGVLEKAIYCSSWLRTLSRRGAAGVQQLWSRFAGHATSGRRMASAAPLAGAPLVPADQRSHHFLPRVHLPNSRRRHWPPLW